MTISKPTGLTTTVLALLNGMFGGSIMVLPILALQVGWFYLSLIVITTVIINWYSCHLVLMHLGNEKDVGSVIINHFKKNKLVITAYNMTTTLGLLTALVVYFKLIVIQIEGLFLQGDRSQMSCVVNGVVVAMWCILTKIWDVDTHISGYGFFSIAAYFVFLLWVALSAPAGQKQIVSDGGSFAGFTAVMNNALTIQFIFIPILKSYTNRAKYPTIMAMTFIIALVFYFYIDGVGAYGIMNRQIVHEAETIEGFFLQGEWQLKLIQIVYLLHLYSVFPQYLLAGKKRFCSLIGKTEDQSQKLSQFEVVFIFAVIMLAVGVSLIDVNIRYIIQFNGTVFGFIYCYLIPVALHIKCCYFTDHSLKVVAGVIEYSKSPVELRVTSQQQDDRVQQSGSKSSKQIVSLQTGQNTNNQWQQQRDEKEEQQRDEKEEQQRDEKEYLQNVGQCYYVKPSLMRQVVDMVLLGLMLSVASYVLVYGLMQIFK